MPDQFCAPVIVRYATRCGADPGVARGRDRDGADLFPRQAIGGDQCSPLTLVVGAKRQAGIRPDPKSASESPVNGPNDIIGHALRLRPTLPLAVAKPPGNSFSA